MRKYEYYSVFMACLFSLSLTGCGGGDGGVDFGLIDQPSQPSFISWSNNANGDAVVDASNDVVKFSSDYGYMVFGNTTYKNITVSKDGKAILTQDGAVVGSVAAIKSVTGSTIAALLCTSGTMVDLIGTEANLVFTCSSVYPTPPDTSVNAPAGPVASTLSFPLDSAHKLLVANGYSVTFTATGSSATESTKGLCSGTWAVTQSPANVATKFAGLSALSASYSSTTNLTNCTPASSTGSSTQFFDTNYIPLGSTTTAGTFNLWSKYVLASAVKVGSIGTVGTMDFYADSTKAVSSGHKDVTYVIEADTANSVIYNEIHRFFNAYVANSTTSDGKLRAVYQYRYRFGSTGAMTPISIDEKTYLTGTTTSSHHYLWTR